MRSSLSCWRNTGGDSSLEHECGNYFDLGSYHFITGVKVAKSFRRAIMSGLGSPQVATRWNSCRSILEIKVGLEQRSPEPIPVCHKSVGQLPVLVSFSTVPSVLRTNQVREIQTRSESSQVSERRLSCQGQQGDRQLVLAWHFCCCINGRWVSRTRTARQLNERNFKENKK